MNKFKNIEKLVNRAIDEQIFPGAVVSFGNNKEQLFSGAYGFHTYEKNRRTDTEDIFDLASLTKVVATTAAVMKLYDESKVELDKPYYKYFNDYDIKCPGKQKITVRQLLSHCSGYPSSNRYIRNSRFKSPEERWKELIENTPLEYETAENTVYSDVNFQILGKIVESVSGKKLNEFVTEQIFKQLDMNETFYNPANNFKKRIVPTEYNPDLKELVKGYVHDPNARILGGVAGHAGLFSTAKDLGKFCRMILNKGIFEDNKIIKEETVALFSKRERTVKNSSRALGWDTAYNPDQQNKSMSYSAGKCNDENKFGHTGFTGTSLWLNSEKNFYAIILTNRVCPSREHADIEDFKKHILDISTEIWKTKR